jgi:hypothetical protein
MHHESTGVIFSTSGRVFDRHAGDRRTFMSSNARRFAVAVAVVAIVASVGAVTAQASRSGSCRVDARDAFQAFGAWGDGAFYNLANGGDFEGGTTQWTLTGGAGVQGGNEPWNLGAGSLFLPAGSSALSTETCSTRLDAVTRFFAKNVGSSSGTLKVELIVRIAGRDYALNAGSIAASSAWGPSAQLAPSFSSWSPQTQLLPSWAGWMSGNVIVQVRLTPVGDGAAFAVDDVYIDPYQSR